MFDNILSESVLSFTNVMLFIKEMNRVLKQNGVLLAIEMVLEDSTCTNVQEIKSIYRLPQLLTESQWIKVFRKSGFNHICAQKGEIQFHENDIDHAADFIPSDNINSEYFAILNVHEQLSKEYEDILGFRIFRCSN